MKRETATIQHLENEYSKEQYAKYAKEQKQVIFRRRRLALVFLLTTITLISMGIPMFNDWLQLQNLTEVQKETLAEQKETNETVQRLEREVAQLNDKNYVAKLARARFLYSKEGEFIYPLPENQEEQNNQKD